MKPVNLSEYLFYIVLIFLFTGMALLIFVLFRGEAERNRLLLEYEAERMTAFLSESMLRNQLNGNIEIDERVIGFGVYDWNGEKIQTWRNAPEKLNSADMERTARRIRYDKKNKSLVIIRRIGRHPMTNPDDIAEHMRRMPRMQPGRPPAIIYLEFDASSYMNKYGLNRISRIGIPAFLLLTMIVTMLLYKKNTEYRKKLVAQAQLAQLGEMARTLSHEIKNPLGAMRIQTGYLKKTLPKKNLADLVLIEEEIERLTLLTRRISDFVRDPAGKPEKINLNTFIVDLLKRYNHPVTFRNTAGSDVTILFDRDRLRSLLENVIMNAIESHESTKEEHVFQVDIELSRTKHGVRVSVLDSGKGIGGESVEHLFDPFYTTKTRGSGMGLAIAKRFCEASGGEIRLFPRDGGGTEVRILFRKRG
ncbi:MAG: HAMP domain-containing histidine kinase [Spirochaetales bacterium]|nr:HAMP domain-containing histidine kinase [Spirochaetales bacterium]